MTTNNDSSNNIYFHDILETTIQDISNNPRMSFINYMTNALANSNMNENLAMLPLVNPYSQNSIINASNSSNIRDIINRTLLQQKSYKHVLSKKGEDQLKKVIFKNTEFGDKECAICMEEFKEGQMIIQLPCKHIFDPESIKTWLKEEQAKCPICRFKLKSKEVKDTNENIEDNANIPPLEPMTSDNRQYNQMFSNMGMLYNPLFSLSSRPQRTTLVNQRNLVNRILNLEDDYLENREIQHAIMESWNNSVIDDEDINELNYDAMHDDMVLEDLEDVDMD